jgi:hypothetical protein
MRGLWMGALLLPLMAASPAAAADKGESCSSHGTAIDFYDTPSDAATKAKKDGKLVLLLHVSGNFEDPRFT